MTDNARAVVQVRLTEADKARLQAAAADDGRTVASWARGLILNAMDKQKLQKRGAGGGIAKTKAMIDLRHSDKADASATGCSVCQA